MAKVDNMKKRKRKRTLRTQAVHVLNQRYEQKQQFRRWTKLFTAVFFLCLIFQKRKFHQQTNESNLQNLKESIEIYNLNVIIQTL